MISNRSQFLSEKIKFLNFKTIKGKLAQFILQAEGGKSEIILEMTQNDLADYFGVARPSVSRVIGELEQEGIIITKGKTLRILDKKGLSESDNRIGDVTELTTLLASANVERSCSADFIL